MKTFVDYIIYEQYVCIYFHSLSVDTIIVTISLLLLILFYYDYYRLLID